jgi:hypothetical protein
VVRRSVLDVGVTMFAVAGLGGFTAGRANDTRRNSGAAQQRDEADEAKHIEASQLIPGVRLTVLERSKARPFL